MRFECGQQRVMRPGWERPGSLALRRVLTNRMREYSTYGSVGGVGGNPGSYPAVRWLAPGPFPSRSQTDSTANIAASVTPDLPEGAAGSTSGVEPASACSMLSERHKEPRAPVRPTVLFAEFSVAA